MYERSLEHLLDGSTFVAFHTEIIKYELELILATNTHLEDLRTDVEDNVEQRCELLLHFFCHFSGLFLTDSLELTKNLKVLNFRAC